MSTYWYDEQRFREELEREEKARAKARRRKAERKRRIAGTVAAALIFGTVAGGTAYGVNRTMNSFLSDVEAGQTAAAAETLTGESASADGSAAAVGDLASAGSTETKTPMSVEQVAAEVMPAMVTISTLSVQEMQSYFGGFGSFGGFGPGSTQEYEVQGAGTGEIVAQKNGWIYIATNEHVISGAKEVSVGFVDGTAAEAQIVGEDPENDLAVVAVRTAGLSEDTLSQIRVISIGSSDDLALGEQVVAIGNALGYGQSVTGGVVSALDRELSFSDGYGTSTSAGLIQTDAAINSGNSGGALLNMYGELIGINEAKSSSTSSGVNVDNMGFAIPISRALPILRDMIGDAV